jgi:hypothetical protein
MKMKRFLPLFIIAIALSSCQEDVKFNTPGFQGLKDDVFWRANDARAYISTSGDLTIEALTEYESITLTTSGANEGVYVLGTANTSNSATYTSNFNGVELEYATIAVPGPVSSIALSNSGSGYVSGSSVATTGGSGSGLTVNVTANASGIVTALTVSSRGNAYVAGDLVTVASGNLNATFRVLNVQNSNGQIEITEYDNVNFTVSGKFKFNAATLSNDPFVNPILNFQYGEFYKIPIFPFEN